MVENILIVLDFMQIELSQRTIDRIKQVHAMVHLIHDRGRISDESLISLLLDHWQSGAPPTLTWLKGQANLYPADVGRKRIR